MTDQSKPVAPESTPTPQADAYAMELVRDLVKAEMRTINPFSLGGKSPEQEKQYTALEGWLARANSDAQPAMPQLSFNIDSDDGVEWEVNIWLILPPHVAPKVKDFNKELLGWLPCESREEAERAVIRLTNLWAECGAAPLAIDRTPQVFYGPELPMKLEMARALLHRVNLENPPDREWCHDYFLFTGEHMILVDENWEEGSALASYREEDSEFEPDDEVNAPTSRAIDRTDAGEPKKLSDRINALPEWVRRYIHDIETRCDPSGDIRTITELQDTIRCLESHIAELDAEIKRKDAQILQTKTTFFYIKNLSHSAWRDPKNLEEVCKRIENYAIMEYDLLEAALASPKPAKEKS